MNNQPENNVAEKLAIAEDCIIKLMEVMRPVVDDVRGRLGHVFEEEDWNEGYQIEVQLTVKEFRAIRDSLS